MMQGAEYFLIGAILLILSIIVSKALSRIGIPSLLIFILIGMLTGSEGLGILDFYNPVIMQFVCVIALIFVLFSAGFDVQATIANSILWPGIGLSIFGVLITALLVAVFAYFVVSLPFIHCLLLGSIISSTDASAVFSILRSSKIMMNRQLKILLEFESGSNDPMAIFLTIVCINFLSSKDFSGIELVFVFLSQLVIGLLIGYGAGKLIPSLLNKINLEYNGLYPVLNVSLILLAYALATSLNGNGFLAAYTAGLMMGKSNFKHKINLYRFHDSFVWLLQITMFLILGLQVFPTKLPDVFVMGIFVSAFIIVIARPVAVFSILSFSNLNLKEKFLVAWTGLRGAVPITLATFPIIAGISHAETIFGIVFFVVITSILIQGTLLSPIAKWLKVNK